MSEIELGRGAASIWSDLEKKAGAIQSGRREVQDRNHATIQFSTKEYPHSYVEIDVMDDSPDPERQVTVFAMSNKMKVVAIGHWTDHDVRFSYTMTSTNGTEVEVTESGNRMAYVHGEPTPFEDLSADDEHLVAFSTAFIKAQQNMPGSGKKTAWDLLCEELKGK